MIKAVLRRARNEGRTDAVAETEVGHRPSDSINARPGTLSQRSTRVLKSVKTAFISASG
jgi:hypothetical protein